MFPEWTLKSIIEQLFNEHRFSAYPERNHNYPQQLGNRSDIYLQMKGCIICVEALISERK